MIPPEGHPGVSALRQIGSIAQEKDARALADYLLTLDISTKLVPKPDGSMAVWVHREDRVPEARRALDEFAQDPADPRYQSASQAARVLRKQAEQADAEYRKNVREMREKWDAPIHRRAPLTAALIAASVAVALFTDLGLNGPAVARLTFSIQAVDPDGVEFDRGFENIRRGEVWRVVTPIFLHFGVWHLFFNMMALMMFGDQIETRKGTWRLALIVAVAAIAGNVGQFFGAGGGFGGMSGVDFALAGYLWVKGHADPEDGLGLDSRNAALMIAWLLLGVVASQGSTQEFFRAVPRMANITHGVGLAVGMGFGVLRF